MFCKVENGDNWKGKKKVRKKSMEINLNQTQAEAVE